MEGANNEVENQTGKAEENINVLEEAKKINAELRQNIAERKTLLEREERLKAVDLLSGRTQAGSQSNKVEETPQQYAERIMKGGKLK